MINDCPFAALSDTAMILAAGFGTRLRPLTLETPKPLLKIGGQAMLDLALDRLKAAGLRRAVVNAYYLADQIAAHVQARNEEELKTRHCERSDEMFEVLLSPETDILDTGGGVQNARALFGDKPFFVMNADLPLIDGAEPALRRMARAWDASRMDVLLLLYPTAKARGFHPRKDGGQGDFMMEADGRVWRKDAPSEKPFVWLSTMIVKPQLYDAIDKRVFSNNEIFDLAESRGRLFGLVHDGTGYEISTPQDLAEANRRLQSGEGWG